MSDKEIEANFKRATNHTGPNPEYEIPDLRYRQNPMSQKRSSGKYRDGCLLNSKRPYTVYQQSPEGLLSNNVYGTKGSHFRFLTEKT